jgi:hypothetical protein
MIQRSLFNALAVVSLAVAAGGCVATSEPEPEPTTGESTQELERICPAIAILCIEGYHAKSVGNCRQICVPDQDKTGCKPGCREGEYCGECRTLTGTALVCLPLGAVC